MRNYYNLLLVLCAFVFSVNFSQGQNVNLKDSKHSSIIKTYFSNAKEKYQFSEGDIGSIVLTKELYSKSTKVTNYYLNQAYKGIRIHNAVATIAIKDEDVFYSTNKFKKDVEKNVNTTKPVLSPEQAIKKVALYFNLGSSDGLQLIDSNGFKQYYSKGGISQESIPVELVFFQNKEGRLRLSWSLSILTKDGSHWWSVCVDALSGKLININDWMLKCSFHSDKKQEVNHHNLNSNSTNYFNLYNTNSSTVVDDGSDYNVFSIPLESPNEGERQIVSNPANSVASPFGWHDVDGVIGVDFTDTQGNNVIAQLDYDGNNGSGALAEGGSALDFNFSLSLNTDATDSQDASITNLFYMNNIMHDVWYQYGFDEVSGNFQQNNYGNAGSGGDRVNADAQDGSGSNNANFATPTDGFNPRMQMFLWSKPSEEDVLTIELGSAAGAYLGLPAAFGELLPVKSSPLIGELVLVVDDNGGGTSIDPNDACDVILNPGELSGKIAVIRRGDCEFGFKVLAAEQNNAIAVIMVNNVSGPPITMAEGADGNQVTIPSIMVNQADGEAIISALANETINVSMALPDRLDSSFDNLVVAHEYGHGISNRLTGGAVNSDCLATCTERDTNGDCIPATYTEQMGEGWSDWFGLMLTMKADDLPSDGRGVGTYLISQPVNGTGFRPYQYSTDTAINPLTYNDTNNTTAISAPHGVGSIWCTMLWDLTWKYIEKYGFDPDLYHGIGGNNKMMQLVIDALKIQSCNPGFVDGRDAILAADMVLTGGQDQCIIWEVFANRGLGLNASQGDSLLRTDQIEDFTLPDPTEPSLENCIGLALSSDYSKSKKTYKVYPNPASNKLIIETSKALGDVVIELLDVNGRKMFSVSKAFVDKVVLNTRKLQKGLYILSIRGPEIYTNKKIIID